MPAAKIPLRVLYFANELSATAQDFAPQAFSCYVPASWRVVELKSHLQREVVKFPIGSLFWKGQAMKEQDALLLFPWKSDSLPTITITKLTQPFRLCEATTLLSFCNRSEAYRLAPVLKALRDVNSHFSQHPHLKSKQATADSGSGGLYFIKNTRSQVLACFKPRSEELGAALNPTKSTLRVGVVPGQGAEREAAAFALDHSGFAGVPPTVLAEALGECFHNGNGESKIGSFQFFQPNAEENVGDYSAHLFPVQDVHKVALLDIRYLNMDRNDSNLLVVASNNKQLNLVPIDHGLCFPDRIEVAWCDWVWWDWPQTLEPFDLETKQWVKMLNVRQDMGVLENTFAMGKQTLRVFYCMTTLLQVAIGKYDLNLRDIASVVVRSQDLDLPSAMEKTVERANELAELMAGNARKHQLEEDDDRLIRSSSFDGLSAAAVVPLPIATVTANATANRRNSKQPLSAALADKLFFSYVDKLVDDICQEVLVKKQQQEPRVNLENTWFDVSQRIPSAELTKMPSPRLLPMKPAPKPSSSLPLMSLSDFSLQ
ncbi:hypothetical protein BASA81_010296 [Batrachochytrium salamandrivorans]|nr:hypothetical protein BASA81_010296 [Batrachochytrium salamandrivorans]